MTSSDIDEKLPQTRVCGSFKFNSVFSNYGVAVGVGGSGVAEGVSASSAW